jgi:Heterokaryon incompatibility protein (HET)
MFSFLWSWLFSWRQPQRPAEDHFDYDAVPVDRERQEIRLIRLHLAGDDEPIECTIKAFLLDKCPSYDTLSYVWGSGKKISIQCNGLRLDILPNLYYALKRYRSQHNITDKTEGNGHEEEPKSSKWVWADAICINQDNDQEKSWQIQLRRKFYDRGQITWIWLGKDDKRTAKAFDLLYTLFYVKQTQEAASDNRGFFEIPPKEREDLGLPHPIISSDYRSLVLLLLRDWYTRVGVEQEFALSHKAMVYCGPHCISWTQLNEAVEHAIHMRLPIYLHTVPVCQRNGGFPSIITE